MSVLFSVFVPFIQDYDHCIPFLFAVNTKKQLFFKVLGKGRVVKGNSQNDDDMPAKSIAQQQAAGIAHAVEKGELPQSKLRGASKRMFKSMHGTGELKKFAKTEHGGLPQKKTSEALTARQMFARDHLHEGRDDALDPAKLNLGTTGRKFARMGSKEAFKGGQSGQGGDAKWHTSAKLRSELAGEQPGAPMHSNDKVGKVKFGGKGLGDSLTPEQVVRAMLD